MFVFHYFFLFSFWFSSYLLLSSHNIREFIPLTNAARNADKTKYMVMSRDRNAGRGHSVKIDNSSIERVEEFKYLGTTLTDQNSIQ
jgi:hypothetical protein